MTEETHAETHTQLKRRLLDALIRREGGYVNDPRDSGGETKWGITKEVARSAGYMGRMETLSRAEAERIYEAKYWRPLELDTVAILSPAIAEELFDTGVNMGLSRASKFLQRSLNVLNQQAKLYEDLVVDGDLGPKTLGALTAYLRHRAGANGERVLLRMLNALQGAFYVDLAERRVKDEAFVYGWFLNRVS